MKGTIFLFFGFWFLTFNGCKKNVLTINEIHISSSVELSNHEKSPGQFISIAWSDLTGNSIDPQYRDNLQSSYESFGDEKLIEKIIVLNMMQRTEVKIPPSDSLYLFPGNFIRLSYQRFFNREPSGNELWQLETLIKHDSARMITPRVVWLSMMLSNEYRKF